MQGGVRTCAAVGEIGRTVHLQQRTPHSRPHRAGTLPVHVVNNTLAGRGARGERDWRRCTPLAAARARRRRSGGGTAGGQAQPDSLHHSPPPPVQPWELFESKMTAAGLSDAAKGAFKMNYEQLVAGVTGLVPDATIDPVVELPRLEALTVPAGTDMQALLQATAVLKLNGGLGTSMGLEKAKSLLEVKNGKSFLDLIAEQIKYTRQKYGERGCREGGGGLTGVLARRGWGAGGRGAASWSPGGARGRDPCWRGCCRCRCRPITPTTPVRPPATVAVAHTQAPRCASSS